MQSGLNIFLQYKICVYPKDGGWSFGEDAEKMKPEESAIRGQVDNSTTMMIKDLTTNMKKDILCVDTSNIKILNSNLNSLIELYYGRLLKQTEII